jgi:hypothetical protein
VDIVVSAVYIVLGAVTTANGWCFAKLTAIARYFVLSYVTKAIQHAVVPWLSATK